MPRKRVSLLWNWRTSHQNRSFHFLQPQMSASLYQSFLMFLLQVFVVVFLLLEIRLGQKIYSIHELFIHLQSVVWLIKSVTSSGAPPAVGTLGTISLSTLAVIYCDGSVIACNFFVYGIINFIMNSVFSTACGICVTKCRHIRGKFLLLYLYSWKRDIRPFREKLIWIRVDKSCLKNARCTLRDRMNHSAVVFCSWDL